MINVSESEIFKDWMRNLKDRTARSIINARIRRLSLGNKGNSKYLRDGITELRIDIGPGYRVYYTHLDKTLVILLCGGDKSTQSADLRKAIDIAANLEVTE